MSLLLCLCAKDITLTLKEYTLFVLQAKNYYADKQQLLSATP